MTVAAATSALGPDWTDPAAIGYPVLVGGVLLGSIVPVVPTGAVVGAAAAVATTTGRLSLTLVVLASALAALLGDVVTFAVARAGGPAAVGWMARGQHPERLAAARRQFGTRGWQLVVVGRLLPAGRVPVLLAAGALDYPWRRLLPAAAVGCLLWAIAYTLLGVVSGGLFDSPVLATVVATILVLLVTVAGSLISRRRRRPKGRDRPVSPPDAGRLLRGGRVLARLLGVWLLSAGALVLLDRWLVGFAMPRWWQPIVVALLVGVLSAVIWPLILRVALPLALFTLGAGSFLLLGAGVLAISFAVPGVVIANFATAVGVAVAMSLAGALASSLIGLDEDELFFRRAARRARGGAAVDDSRPPGVIFLQVDGLAHDVARRAVRDGNMPTFANWLAAGSHRLTHWNTDWSSQTGAGVCGILHGRNDDILGYRWYEKDRDHVVVCGTPEDAAEIERRHSDGRGLLAVDGAGHGNLFTGDAPHVSLTMSALPLLTGTKRRRRRAERVGAGYFAYFSNPANALRTLVGFVVDVLREISASTRQRRAGVRPRMARGGFYPFARAATTVIARDIVVSAVIEDMLAGRSCVYVDLLGYDEVAHHSGIERFDTLGVLRAIDRQIGRLYRATQLAPRRYHVICLSDHGQTQGLPFAQRFGETIEELIGRLCGASAERRRASRELHGERQRAGTRRSAEGWQVGAVLAEACSGGGPIARRLRSRVQRAEQQQEPAHPMTDEGAVTRVAPGVVVVLSGHTAMISFTAHDGRVELETIEREYPDLLPALVDHEGVGFLLVRSGELGPMVYGRDGELRLGDGTVTGRDPLAGYGPHAAELIRRFDSFPRCPDVVVNSRYDPATDDASPFEPHVGSHGGLGGPQARGFLIHPAELPEPGEIVGAEHLHRVLRSWLTHLGHPVPEPVGETGALPDPATRTG